MRILITGSSGRVGQAIANEISKYHSVIGLDLIVGPHTQVQGDINNRALLDKLLSKVDAIIHTAALHAPHIKHYSKQQFIETNLQGTKRLLELAHKHNLKRFVYTSTTSLYGDAMLPDNEAVWVTETLKPMPRDIYDETKLAAEEACHAATNANFTAVSLRISRCFPEPEPLMSLYRLYRGVDLRDVAQAHHLALSATLPNFEIFNISANPPFKKEDTPALLTNASAVIEQYYPQIRSIFSHHNWSLPNCIDRVYVIEKAKNQLGYQPNYNFDKRLAEMTHNPKLWQ